MSDQGLHGKRVDLYDRIYHWKDYGTEAERVHEILQEYGVAPGARVVEAACGTGTYLKELGRWYSMSGYDLSEDMVAAARRKVPDVEVLQGDVRDFVPSPPADALVCLFSSIGYVYPESELSKAAECFYKSVRPGGVVLVEPWLTPEVGKPGHFRQHTWDGDDMSLVRTSTHVVEGRKSIFDFNWLVTTKQGVEHFIDRHELWLYTTEEMVSAFEGAGFEVTTLKDGLMPQRGLIIAVRPDTGPGELLV